MKKLWKSLAAFLLCLSMLCGSLTMLTASAKTSSKYADLKAEKIDDKIPTAAKKYAKSNYKSFVEAAGNSKIDASKCTLGDPYFIGTEQNIEQYYFPVIYNKKPVYVLNVINTTSGWTGSLSTEMVDVLKDLKYLKNSNYVFTAGDTLIVYSPVETNVYQDFTASTKKTQAAADYKKKINEVSKKMDTCQPLDSNKNGNPWNFWEILEEYVYANRCNAVLVKRSNKAYMAAYVSSLSDVRKIKIQMALQQKKSGKYKTVYKKTKSFSSTPVSWNESTKISSSKTYRLKVTFWLYMGDGTSEKITLIKK